MTPGLLEGCAQCVLQPLSQEEIELQRRSQKIDREIRKEERLKRKQVKLLLLGAGESGKSTFLKQMRIIHNVNYDVTAQIEFRKIIYQNIIKGTKVLVDAQRKLGIPLSNPENHALGSQLLLFDNFAELNNKTFPEFESMISSLWSDEGIKRAYNRRNEYQITDSVSYFLENLVRISKPEYVPTLQDILFARKTTKGVVEFTISIDNVPFLFVDVGGQRTQRQKWMQCFDSVTSILFLASSSEFDQVILEDRRTNRLMESRNIFDTIVNNRIFNNVSVILFLNKLDLLKQKISQSNISRHIPEFKDLKAVEVYSPGFRGIPDNLEDVKKFLVYYFISARRMSEKPLYHHFTVAVDTNNVKLVFRDVKDIILKKNLDSLLLQ
ncbi:guanine nucleotide-binding protein subunit alpha-12 [Eurytemora carolleeae]|uniref:guanine nucleotide-binding protein subunit alpha-12 n=1 Tax=Eurytemora carolleeae TaxID=1294199 RepID=UPI000C77F485|nr:guanine nucleotide-binding protein subunit alpha-12 [Eurytemora carolleeae]|eukprot:XP_023343117.1 guanine nucleotide-binding protein subunit alpha-12-like [Eurytemora affinis]